MHMSIVVISESYRKTNKYKAKHAFNVRRVLDRYQQPINYIYFKSMVMLSKSFIW